MQIVYLKDSSNAIPLPLRLLSELIQAAKHVFLSAAKNLLESEKPTVVKKVTARFCSFRGILRYAQNDGESSNICKGYGESISICKGYGESINICKGYGESISICKKLEKNVKTPAGG